MKLKLKDIFNWLKNIYGLFLSFVNITYKTCNDKVDLFYFYCQSIFPQKKIWIFDACDYGNLGDQAILYAQIKYLKKIFPNHRILISPISRFSQIQKNISKITKHEDLIFLQGGGNLGNYYLRAENIRREIVTLLPENKIILFPQTIYFSNDANGQKELLITKQIYNKHKHLLLIAREETSYNVMQKNFNCPIILLPDIVLLLNYSNSQTIKYRNGCLICLRNDIESILKKQDKEYIYYTLLSQFDKKDISFTDTIGQNSYRGVLSKINHFKKKKLVITDRIHGMIFAAISETPCIVISNYNYKVSGTYKWISYLSYIQYINEIEDLPNTLKKMDLSQNYSFNNVPIWKEYSTKLIPMIRKL